MNRSHIPILKPGKKKKPKSKLQRGGRIKPVSAKRVKINKIYSALRKEFMAKHPICQFWLKENGWVEEDDKGITKYSDVLIGGHMLFTGYELHLRFRAPSSEDVHHMKGRGKYLLDTATWMAVSRKAHDWIHANPKESYEKGYLLPR